MRTTEEIMHRGRALEAEGYDEIPISRLLGPGWLENEPLRAALRELRRQGRLLATDSPGWFRLA